MKWGTEHDGNIVSNARSENEHYAMYRKCQRCVIIINGYYEWKEEVSQSGITSKHPYYFHHSEKDYILLAGLFKVNTDEVILIGNIRMGSK
jgi:putative SOS response-associated peptidase YedK